MHERARWIVGAAAGLLASCLTGCISTPTPLSPELGGSVGAPHRGVLTDAVKLPQRGEGFVRFRSDDIRWGSARLVHVIEHAARTVGEQRPGGAPLVVADLSAQSGGKISRHRSHRTGRDADLLLFATTADGRPVRTPGFVRFGRDGLTRTKVRGKTTYLRIDIERQWLLVKALIQAPEAHVQWLFVSRWLEAMLVDHALARGEDLSLIWHAETVLHQPSDSASHDDHIHMRLACTPDEATAGCVGGPRWPWLPELPKMPTMSDDKLLAALLSDP